MSLEAETHPSATPTPTHSISLPRDAMLHDLVQRLAESTSLSGVVFRNFDMPVTHGADPLPRPEVWGWARFWLQRHPDRGWMLMLDYIPFDSVGTLNWLSVVTTLESTLRNEPLVEACQLMLKMLLLKIARQGQCDQDVDTLVSTVRALDR